MRVVISCTVFLLQFLFVVFFVEEANLHRLTCIYYASSNLPFSACIITIIIKIRSDEDKIEMYDAKTLHPFNFAAILWVYMYIYLFVNFVKKISNWFLPLLHSHEKSHIHIHFYYYCMYIVSLITSRNEESPLRNYAIFIHTQSEREILIVTIMPVIMMNNLS